MYSILCNYYDRSFSDIDDLIVDVMNCGVDPSCDLLYNDEPTGEQLSDYLVE